MLYDIKKLFKITGNSTHFIILLLLRAPTDALLTIINAEFLCYAFNKIEEHDSAKLTFICIVFTVANLCIFLYNGTIWTIYSSFVVQIEGKLRFKLFKKISKLSYEDIEKTSHGDWLTILNSDVQMPFSQPMHLPHAFNAIVRISLSSIILYHMNMAVFGWVMLFIIPHILISQLLVARVMPKLNKYCLEATAKNTDTLSSFVLCADIIALYDGQDYLMKKFEANSLELLRIKMMIKKRHALNAAISILPFGLSGYLILLIVSNSWIANGNITFGELTAAFQYRSGILIGVMMLINSLVSIQASMAGIRRINNTMERN